MLCVYCCYVFFFRVCDLRVCEKFLLWDMLFGLEFMM